VRHPLFDFQEMKVSSREVDAKFPQPPALDGPQSVLWNPKSHGHVTNPARAAGLGASGAKGMPPNRVFAVFDDVRLQAW